MSSLSGYYQGVFMGGKRWRWSELLLRLAVIVLSSVAVGLVSLVIALWLNELLHPTSISSVGSRVRDALADPVVAGIAYPVALVCWIFGLIGAVVLLLPTRLIVTIPLVGMAVIGGVGIGALFNVMIAPLVGEIAAFLAMFSCRFYDECHRSEVPQGRGD